VNGAVAVWPKIRLEFRQFGNNPTGEFDMPRLALLALAGASIFATTMPFAISVQADDTGMATSLHAVRREGGRLCLVDHWHSGSGDGSTKARAQNAAIRSWSGFTNFEFGSDWARYGLAASKSVRYSKSDSGWSAYIEARPCRR